MKNIYYRALIIWLSVKWMFKTNPLDTVIYINNRWLVINGTRLNSWFVTSFDAKVTKWIPKKDCKKVIMLSGLILDFKMGYRFYMRSWYSIWCNEGIKPWMRTCNIW